MPCAKERLKWFNGQRFGMFIHWGLYSIASKGEWYRYHEDVPADEYHALADEFNPRFYRPGEWARLARNAGMRYMVLTAKHHDGYCLFDSRYTDFTSVKTAAKRDFVREYADACRAEGLGVGLYFSCKDWDFPGYFRGPDADPEGFGKMVEHFHNQTLELMSNYGRIDILFYDCSDDANFRGNWGDKTASEVFGSKELNAKIRRLQPDIIINDRSGEKEDYGTPENTILNVLDDNGRMYETCMTMNSTWGYRENDHEWKSVSEIISQLVSCASLGCNYLLNLGPDRDGRIPQEAADRLYRVGMWLKANGEAIYGTDRVLPNWWNGLSNGLVTTKGNHVYLCVKEWPADGVERIVNIKNRVLSAKMLVTGRELSVRRDGRRVIIEGLPVNKPGPWINVVDLEVEGKPEAQFYY